MNERGSLLFTAVWMVCIFSIMAASLAVGAGGDLLIMKRELAGLRSRTAFSSGVAEAARLIQEDTQPYEDSRYDAWYGDWKPDATGKRGATIHVEDEESKLNLNQASAALLDAFFKEFQEEVGPLKGERKNYIKSILKLKFEKRIESLEELLLIEDFDKTDFAVLKPYLTVYSDLPHLNPNTASTLVLKALVESLGGDHGSKQVLLSRLEEVRHDGTYFFSIGDLNPESFAEKLKLPRTPLMMQLVQQLVVALGANSETFRIVMKSADGMEASGVFRFRVGQERPRMMWWYEK